MFTKNIILFLKYIKYFATINMINCIKSEKLTFYFFMKENSNYQIQTTFKNFLNIKLDYEIKILYMLIKYSINSYFAPLIKNAPVCIYMKFLTVYNVDYINRVFFLLNLVAVRLNNKMYSKFCFLNFVNTYQYFFSKKLIFKLFVLKIKSANSKQN